MQKASTDGERKKRKMEEEEEEDEEEKIEKFFALVRSTRQVRDLLRGSTNIGSKERKCEAKIEEEEKAAPAGAWNPAFKPEDFLEDDKSAGDHHGAGPSKTEEDEDEDKNEGIGLDLKLSL